MKHTLLFLGFLWYFVSLSPSQAQCNSLLALSAVQSLTTCLESTSEYLCPSCFTPFRYALRRAGCDKHRFFQDLLVVDQEICQSPTTQCDTDAIYGCLQAIVSNSSQAESSEQGCRAYDEFSDCLQTSCAELGELPSRQEMETMCTSTSSCNIFEQRICVFEPPILSTACQCANTSLRCASSSQNTVDLDLWTPITTALNYGCVQGTRCNEQGAQLCVTDVLIEQCDAESPCQCVQPARRCLAATQCDETTDYYDLIDTYEAENKCTSSGSRSQISFSLVFLISLFYFHSYLVC